MTYTNREVRTALRYSIQKWKKIAAGTGIDNGTEDCPLCQFFWYNSCEGCPVREHTGLIYCKGSPFVQWDKVQNYHQPVRTPAQEAAARAELRFLKMLEKKYFEGMPE